jgi:membrane-bound serine protease (ClpP class)
LLLIIGVTLAYIFLDWPLRLLVIIPLAIVESLEIMLFFKLRNRRPITGAEAIVGTAGTAITDCEPDGQVRVKGQIWKAHASDGVKAGDDVIVTDVEGIRLEVARR